MATLSRFGWRDLLWFVAGWLVATVAIRFLRELPWSLAAIAGAACAALLVATLTTGRSLRAAAGGRRTR